MKIVKMLGVGLIAAGMLAGFSGKAEARGYTDDQRVYVPNYQLRGAIYESIINQGIIGEDQIPTVDQVKLSDLEDVGISSSGETEIGGELFGIQYLKKAKTFGGSFPHNIYDFRPVAGMESLETITLGMNPIDERESNVDISFMTDLSELKNISCFEYNVLDLTPMNNLDNLEYINIGNPHRFSFFKGTPQLISTDTKELKIVNPVTYSEQFEGLETRVMLTDEEGHELGDEGRVSVDGKIITISNVDEGSASIKMIIEKSNADNTTYHRLQYNVPLEWY